MSQHQEESHPLERVLANQADLAPQHTRIESIQPHLPEFHSVKAPPCIEIQSEQPWHRLLAYMLLQGATTKQCADQFGKSASHISQVRKQHWFGTLLTQLANLSFDQDLVGLLHGSAVTAIETLTELAQTAESESVKRSAASTLLEQYLRNKPQAVPKETKSPRDELDELNAEIRNLEGKL